MNTKLLKRVKAKILKEPKQFDMDRYFTPQDRADWEIPNCGTAACIGGWAVCLIKRKRPLAIYNRDGSMGSCDSAQKALDINYEEAVRLFIQNQWPLEFKEAYLNTPPGSKGRAKAAAARIDHFIKTKGAE